MFDEITWLEQAGHDVAHFAAGHPQNDPSPWSHYFAPYLELGEGAGLSLRERGQAAWRMFSNADAARSFAALVEEFRPDVVHVHGIHRQLSPSVLGVARRCGVPVVQTLHDYHHVCPNDTLLYRDRQVCEPRRCRTVWYGACVSGRCVRGSVLASALSAAETSWQRMLSRYENGVSRFISPSEFLAEQMRRGGWKLPCDVVPNAVELTTGSAEPGEGFCVIGRLAREKGVEIALESARRAGARVTVAGEGPLESTLRASFPEVEFVGRLSASDVDGLVARSRATIVPSLWFENASMSVLETMAAGRPVIASAIGGVPEQVTNGKDGVLVTPGDVSQLTTAIRRLSDDRDLCVRLGAAAQQTVATRFAPTMHVERLLSAYHDARTDR